MTVYTEPQIILNDGTVLQNSGAGYSDHKLWCWVEGVTMTEAFAMFSDPAKTSVIRHRYGTKEEVYRNFTNITLIRTGEFSVHVRMEGTNTSIDIHDIPDETQPGSEE